MSTVSAASSLPMPLAKLMPGCFSADEEKLEINSLASDSRKVMANSLYFAVKSQSSNVVDYVAKAISSGAVAVATDDEKVVQQFSAQALEKGSMESMAVSICFDDQMSAKLSSIASTFYQHPSKELSVVGITGTNGKTSCCFWLAWLFNEADIACGQIGTLGFSSGLSSGLNSGFGSKLVSTGFTTPDPIQSQQLLAECRAADAQAVVMEVSSHGLDQGRVEAVEFKSAIFTNLTQDHLDYHGTMANYIEAKLKLFKRKELSHAIINLDDSHSETVADSVSDGTKIYTYSLKNKEADLYFSSIHAVSGGYQVCLHFSGGKFGEQSQKAELIIPVFGEYNLSNVLAVSAVAVAHSVEFNQLVSLLSVIPGVPGRLELVRAGAGSGSVRSANSQESPKVLVDFAHTPDAVASVLSLLRTQTSGRLIVVLGCGGGRDSSKRPLMARAAVKNSDVQFFTSDNPRFESPQEILSQMLSGLSVVEQSDTEVIVDRKQAIDAAIREASSADVIAVLGRGHETHQDIMGEKHEFKDVHISAMLLQQCIDEASKVGGQS